MKLGGATNVVLGVGDPERFSLLGGSFGQAGDFVTGQGGGQGARFFKSGKAAILKAAYGAAQGGKYGDGGGALNPDRGSGGRLPNAR